ncbi:MAG: hypothetical protein Q8O92_04130, partial [Candidatus Latescibacter sp.]|nr:hypothetical protein [Candidatus Latescibacter sp.]
FLNNHFNMTTYFIAFLFKIDAETVVKRCAALSSFPRSGNKFGMTRVILNSFQDLNTQNMRNYLCRHV